MRIIINLVVSALDHSYFSELRVGERARILGFEELDAVYRNRLLSLGLTPGTELLVQQVAPLGDPVQVAVRGFRLSLRRQEAAGMRVQRL